MAACVKRYKGFPSLAGGLSQNHQLDASAALSALFNDGFARRSLAADQLHAPHLIDSKVASGLRRTAAAGRVDAKGAGNLLDTWRRLGLIWYAIHPLLARVWQLRDNLSADDAGYVALAESLNSGLITADAKLSNAPGIRSDHSGAPVGDLYR